MQQPKICQITKNKVQILKFKRNYSKLKNNFVNNFLNHYQEHDDNDDDNNSNIKNDPDTCQKSKIFKNNLTQAFEKADKLVEDGIDENSFGDIFEGIRFGDMAILRLGFSCVGLFLKKSF